MTLDVARARAETPGCRQVAHFNNAGAALMPRAVVDTVIDHLRLESEMGGYEAAGSQRLALVNVYESVAELLGAQPDEIALVESATRAWDMAFYSLRFNPGDRILTSEAEYASNYLAFLQVAQRTGAVIEVVPSDEHGQISLLALERALERPARLIALTHVPTNGGLVNPAAEVGRLARAAGVLYLLDACQSAGQMPLDVQAIGCDMLSATGRKYLRGPRGTGFLYVHRSLIEQLEPPLVDLHAATWTERDRYELRSDARRFESWESSIASRLGLGAAVRYALDWGLETIEERVTELADMLREALSEIPGLEIRDLGVKRCGIVTFTVKGQDPEHIKQALGREAINLTTSSRPSTRLDMEARGLESVVRASVHYYNSEAEILRLVEAITRRSGDTRG